MQAAKKQLRKEIKKRISSLTEEEKLLQSNNVTKQVLQHPKYVSSKRLSIFLSMNDEVKTDAILKQAFQQKKDVYIPKYIGNTMDMVKLESLEDYNSLPETSWHIKQPSDNDNSRPNALVTGGLDLILMPGLGFSTDGKRLGRGKGYYDNYIKKLQENGYHPYLLALAYSVQLCNEIPVSEFDYPVHEVLYSD
ncbi:5-formyltetrahydrofolate cyclo-ligase-like [Styela clava]|uniref:5-formyltetrahydrofolate cyclo-ligase-like n=1 Tax=Styela clava TaxID=7725 RepID=UPI00193A387F|nr:5-formyltetrahydrofolate cyclo-ligase-like [Styela clava]